VNATLEASEDGISSSTNYGSTTVDFSTDDWPTLSGLSVVFSTDSIIQISVPPVMDPALEQYRVYRSESPFNDRGVGVHNTNDESESTPEKFKDTGLDMGSKYYYRMDIVVDGYTSPISPQVSGVTSVQPPINLKAEQTGEKEIIISWDIAGSNSGGVDYDEIGVSGTINSENISQDLFTVPVSSSSTEVTVDSSNIDGGEFQLRTPYEITLRAFTDGTTSSPASISNFMLVENYQTAVRPNLLIVRRPNNN
jgi:hypothetical protein